VQTPTNHQVLVLGFLYELRSKTAKGGFFMNLLQKQLLERTGTRAFMSACTAHPLALEAVLDYSESAGVPALIEATANQVNQFGGYTGMTPADYAAYILRLSDDHDCDVILGGDHLGPLVWRNLSEDQAMENSRVLVSQYVQAGFSKIHLDTSMRLASDPPALSNETIAARAADLCKHAEAAANPENPPVYVVGSEVPIPGGAEHAEESISVTHPEDFMATVAAFKDAFEAQGLKDAWNRVIAVVIQPGVEFGDDQIFEYDRERASSLTSALKPLAPLVFEGHSTDYQTPEKLRQMAEDGIALLKVGPALTFAVREALFALSEMEKWLVPTDDWSHFTDVLEDAMLQNPSNWNAHYHGSADEQAFKRRFSLSDRARYYMTVPSVEKAVSKLLHNINTHKPPISLLSQYMPMQYAHLREGKIELSAESLVKSRVTDCIETYPVVN
jgi:D-tagatose-1,6-bisphosphate aldolase subunit GatZ/KbaZ